MTDTASRGHDGTDGVRPADWADTSAYIDPQYLLPENTISHPFRLISSTCVSYIGYDEPTQVLYVCLVVEGVDPFKYGRVPAGVYYEFMAAASKGKFYNKTILAGVRDEIYDLLD